jgi:peptidoglycan/LPS O-acetylase OafA/YrhL
MTAVQGDDMTPEQVIKRRGWSYGLFGGGIACLYTAYQYAKPVVGIAEPPPEWAPYLFGILGIIGMLVGGIIMLQLRGQNVQPAKPDLGSPQGKTVLGLAVIGIVALAGSLAIDLFAPDGDMVWLSVSGVLLLVMLGCFVICARIAKKLRAEQPAK